MKLYFVALGLNIKGAMVQSLIENQVVNVLVSYFYIPTNEILNGFNDIFLDSGAFSAFIKSKVIDIDEYIDFIYKYKDKIKVYANLDVIGDYKKTAKNQKYMESKGLKPLPVFHYGEPIGLLREMIEEYDYIALGGLVNSSIGITNKRKFLDKCFSIIQDKCKIHGFGLSNVSMLEKYPFYSVDSTNWIHGQKFGTWIEIKNSKIDSYKKSDILKQKVHYNVLGDYHFRRNQGLKVYLKVEKYITELWKKRGIVWNE